MARLWDLIKSLAVVAALGWLAWYAYSLWAPAPSDVNDTVRRAAFNCRTALAGLATDYACMNSDSCTMTPDELNDLRNLEADIERHCN